jgi:hypothetical protein
MDRAHANLALAGAIALGAAAPMALAQRPPAGTAAPTGVLAPTAQEQNGIPYLSGGVGLDQRQAMAKMASPYNLRLSFSEAEDAHYVVGVRVTVRDAADEVVLNLADAGPLLYAELPAGSYRVIAEHNGAKQTRAVSVGEAAQTAAYFHWPAMGAVG